MKHINKEGSRQHVLFWNDKYGAVCSEPDCENNKYWMDRAKQSGIDTAKFLKDLDGFEKKSRKVNLMVK